MVSEAARAIFGRTVSQMVRSVKGVIFLLLAAFPWGVALLLKLLVLQGAEVPLGGSTLYGTIVVGYYLGFFVPLATLFFGVSLVADEAEGGTLPYLFGRPVPRMTVLLAKVGAMAAVLCALIGGSLVGTYLLCSLEAGAGAVARDAGTFLADMGVLALGVLVYGALFAFIGLAFKKPLFWGFFLGFGWENLVAWLPGFLKRLTVLFHLHTLLPHPTAPQGLLNLLASSESKVAALAFLAFYGVAFTLLGCLLVRRMEAPAQEREGG
jgi:ABC-type transport system involved in multi-copper enzyme maturation permease subunit